MINQIIVDYLQHNKRLVVPQFGAFIRKEESQQTTFVPFLRKDDGVLGGLIAQQLGIGTAEAMSMIDAFALEVKQCIATQGGYTIEGLGRLQLDTNGIYCLNTSGDVVNPPVPQSTVGAATSATVQPSAAPFHEPTATYAQHPVQTAEPVRPTQPAQSAQPNQAQTAARPMAQHIETERAAADYTRQPQPSTQPVHSSNQQRPDIQQRPNFQPRPETQQRPAGRQQNGYGQATQPSGQRPQPRQPQERPSQRLQQRPVQQGQRAAATPSDTRQLRPMTRRPGTPPPMPSINELRKKTKTDGFIAMAIIAAAIALGVMIFGYIVSSDGPDIEPLVAPAATAVPADSTATTK